MKYYHLGLLFLTALVVAGCNSTDGEDLRNWMQTQRSEAKPKIQEIPAPKNFVPLGYEADRMVDPFSDEKFKTALAENQTSTAGSSGLMAPELSRRKQPLEAVPLTSMKMVGSVDLNNDPVALIKVDNLIYQVRKGQYLGQDYGKVVAITETQLQVRELVQDAVGEWMERPAVLLLNEDGSK